MSAALQLVHCRPPEPLKCEILKGGMDGIAEFECGAPAQFRSILDGWIMCLGMCREYALPLAGKD